LERQRRKVSSPKRKKEKKSPPFAKSVKGRPPKFFRIQDHHSWKDRGEKLGAEKKRREEEEPTLCRKRKG
jgi:hypothetical protein